MFVSQIYLYFIMYVFKLKFQLLAQAISRTMTMVAEQVVKDDDGNEVSLSVNFQHLIATFESQDVAYIKNTRISCINGHHSCISKTFWNLEWPIDIIKLLWFYIVIHIYVYVKSYKIMIYKTRNSTYIHLYIYISILWADMMIYIYILPIYIYTSRPTMSMVQYTLIFNTGMLFT